MEHKHFELTELKTDNEARTIEGWGSVFNVVDKGKDIVLPGAFAKSLKNRKPAMLWQHRSDEPIGVWEEAAEFDRGLYLKGRFSKTARGNDAYELAKDKAIKGLSIGYSVKQHEYDSKKGIRKLVEVELWETSLVTFPMNEMAKVTRVKAAHENEREFEEFLREAGYSRDAAKVIVAKGFKALSGQREAEAEQVQALSQLFNQFKT